VFVANPNKTEPIVELLSFNKEKLLKYLSDFHTDKGAVLAPPVCAT
jgi:calcium binding protein 39